jgi:hypothetical protein
MGFDLPRGALAGRVLTEALAGAPSSKPERMLYLRSAPVSGKQTLLAYQEHDGVRYLDKACFVAPATSDAEGCE